MRIRRIAILPSLFTLANALCGLAAITFLWRAFVGPGEPHNPKSVDILYAGYFVLLGMVFDALDGRVARIARATSDFGGQLDSVADTVTFGVAPAFLMNRIVVEALRGAVPDLLLQLTWVCAGVYLSCVLVRLARFNVENVHDEEAHQAFKGLPSPAAAGALVSLVIVLAAVWQGGGRETLSVVMVWILPLAAVVLGLLMVSRIRYVHLLNYLLRGHRPFGHLIRMILMIAATFLMLHFLRHTVLVLGFGGYALSGPVLRLFRRDRGEAEEDEGEDEAPGPQETNAPPGN